MRSKAQIRTSLLDQRQELSAARRQEAKQHVLRTLYVKLTGFKKVLSFASKEEEIDCWPLNKVLAAESRLLLPRMIDAFHFEPFEVHDLSRDLVCHPKWNVKQPHFDRCAKVAREHVQCVLVPGLGFDTRCHRIGYGKGIYDRFLKGITCPVYGIGFKEQHINGTIPVEPYDVALTAVFLF